MLLCAMRSVDGRRMLYVGGVSVFQIDRYFEYRYIPTTTIRILTRLHRPQCCLVLYYYYH